MKRSFVAIIALVVVLGLTLGGCGCFQEAKKGETPPPAPAPVVKPAPDCPPCPACPPAVVCPPEKVCPPCPACPACPPCPAPVKPAKKDRN